MKYVYVFSSDTYGSVGFYKLLLNFNLSEIQTCKNISIGKIIFCGNRTFFTFVDYLVCRFFFIVEKKKMCLNLKLFNVFFEFLFDSNYYHLYKFFYNLDIYLFFGGVYIYNLYFFFIDRYVLSLFYKKYYGNLIFPFFYYKFYYVIFFFRNSKYIFILFDKKRNFCFF